MIRSPRPPLSTLFPYTTLFRSAVGDEGQEAHRVTGRAMPRPSRDVQEPGLDEHGDDGCEHAEARVPQPASDAHADAHAAGDDERSEEHTSELQSRSDLVCRLLL